MGWHTANDAVLAEGHRVLIADPAWFDGVAVIGVDEHAWRHTRLGDSAWQSSDMDARCMDEDEFWEVIAEARLAVGDGADDRNPPDDPLPDALRRTLVRLEPDRIIGFMVRACRMADLAFTYPLWGAAFLIEGGCGDDGFMDFRDGLILQGRAVFERAVADPDSLADVPVVQLMARSDEGWLSFEGLAHPVRIAFEQAGGGDDTAFDAALAALESRPAEPSGDGWDFEDDEATGARLPRLAQLFRPDGASQAE